MGLRAISEIRTTVSFNDQIITHQTSNRTPPTGQGKRDTRTLGHYQTDMASTEENEGKNVLHLIEKKKILSAYIVKSFYCDRTFFHMRAYSL